MGAPYPTKELLPALTLADRRACASDTGIVSLALMIFKSNIRSSHVDAIGQTPEWITERIENPNPASREATSPVTLRYGLQGRDTATPTVSPSSNVLLIQPPFNLGGKVQPSRLPPRLWAFALRAPAWLSATSPLTVFPMPYAKPPTDPRRYRVVVGLRSSRATPARLYRPPACAAPVTGRAAFLATLGHVPRQVLRGR